MDNKEKILLAALDAFAEKGHLATTMEEIAVRAKLNKAMVYYYYSSKENLFQEVIKFITDEIYQEFQTAAPKIPKASDPVKTIKSMVSMHYRVFSQNAKHARIFMDVLLNAPDSIKNVFSDITPHSSSIFRIMLQVFQEGYERKLFRNIDYRQVIVSIIGMNVVYALAKPITEAILGLTVENEEAFYEERLQTNIDLILNGILYREPTKTIQE
jgi:AcrR family transcriptional regulator